MAPILRLFFACETGKNQNPLNPNVTPADTLTSPPRTGREKILAPNRHHANPGTQGKRVTVAPRAPIGRRMNPTGTPPIQVRFSI